MYRIAMLLIAIFAAVVPASAQDKFHVFPQYADGRLSDGTSYRSTLMVLPWFDSDAAVCAFTMYGMSADVESVGKVSSFSINLPVGTFLAARTLGVQSIQTGYGTLTCDEYVYAQVLFSFYGSNGQKLSEATVFSSAESYSRRIIADHREGARTALAITNTSDLSRLFDVTYLSNGVTRTGTVTVPARRNSSRFLDEILTVPAGSAGLVTIAPRNFSLFSAIGFKYTGVAFTTIPAQ